ncbi:MAG: hypothetical protein C0506_13355 [Anaerolinea sp.]|nr:hypothetical protein [Anaerolinea sp.]
MWAANAPADVLCMAFLRRLVLSLRLRRVKWKIMLPFAVLTGLFAVFATRNITELVTSSLDDKLRAQLVSGSQQTADEVAKRERDHLEVVRSVAFTQGVSEALANGDQNRLEALVLPQAANAAIEGAEVFDRSGKRVYGVWMAGDSASRQTLPPGLAPAEWTAVWAAIAGRSDARGDKWAQLAMTGNGPALLTAGPIFDEQGMAVGAVVVTTRLDTILRGIKRETLGEIAVFDSTGSLMAATFDAADASAGNGFFRGTGSGGTPGSQGSGSILGRQYRFLNSDLRVRGEPIGAASFALSLDALATTSQSARLRMSLIFGGITVAVMAVGWLIARELTGPLGLLVAAATSVSKGDLSARSNVRTGDEIGMLGMRFDAMAERLEQQHIATIGALASAIEARDPYTAGHSVRVGDLSAELGSGMGMPRPALHHLRVGGLLHDIGKIGVRDTVLLKPGRLSDDERRLIEQHPTIGLRILESADLPREVLEIVGGHHERLNGSGYPLGLSAEELSMFPRITAVADVYDALTTDRPYRPAMSPQEALRILWRDAEAGLMDSEVVATMRRIVQLWEERRAIQGVQTKAWIDSLEALRSARREAA